MNDEAEELESLPDLDTRSYEEVLVAVEESLGPAKGHACDRGDNFSDGDSEEVNIQSVSEPKSILKSPKKHKGLQTKALHWADEVNEPLQTEHTIPHWDRRPNLAMFRLDLMRAARQPIDEAICCFMSQKTLVGVGLVSLILLGSIAVVLLFKLIGFI